MQRDLFLPDEVRFSAEDVTRIHNAEFEAKRNSAVNFEIAKIYLHYSDPAFSTRTWQHVMDSMEKLKSGETRKRWHRAMMQNPFDRIRDKILIRTKAQDFVDVLAAGTVCTNIFLRRLHNFALDMEWIAKAVIPRRLWPKIETGETRSITIDEHKKILSAERNPDWRDYYELLWYLGASQTDTARLTAEDVDWSDRTIAFARLKTESPVLFYFGKEVGRILERRPREGFLFPHIANWTECSRAKAFTRRKRLAGVAGVTLASYRYAWAERARSSGYPERFAQEALGHKSAAVHRQYAKKARVKIPSLEDYESSRLSRSDRCYGVAAGRRSKSFVLSGRGSRGFSPRSSRRAWSGRTCPHRAASASPGSGSAR